MPTSITDLLTALDHETNRRDAHAASDAAGALDVIGRLIDELRTDGIGAADAPARDATARRLGDSCREAAITFHTGPGRLSDLTGVIRDAAGQLRAHLSDEDRWSITAALASYARRCAGTIARSGPYRHIPQLLGVTDRTRELLRVAAAHPPDAAHSGALDLPIPKPMGANGAPPLRSALEALATLTAEFTRRDRDPMTIRQLLGICHVAELVANYVVQTTPTRADDQHSDRARQAALAWRRAREAIANYADQPATRAAGHDRVLPAVLWAVASLERAHTEPAGTDDRHMTPRISALLPRLAAGCDHELERIQPRLYVRRAARPLREDRVAEWLQRKTFSATQADILPARAALMTAARHSIALATALHPETAIAVTNGPLISVELPV